MKTLKEFLSESKNITAYDVEFGLESSKDGVSKAISKLSKKVVSSNIYKHKHGIWLADITFNNRNDALAFFKKYDSDLSKSEAEEYLGENKKAEKELDKVMSSKDGDALASALDKGDEDKALKILKKNKVKDTDGVLDLMFGSL